MYGSVSCVQRYTTLYCPLSHPQISLVNLGGHNAQEEALSRVVSVMACSTAAARSLLIHFRWDTDTLFGALPLSFMLHYQLTVWGIHFR
jgi:hypothetical protein